MPFDRFRIVEELHRTRAATILKATRNCDDKKVILKVVRRGKESSSLARLRHEAGVIERLRCSSVINSLGLFEDNDSWVLALEDIGGRGLDSCLDDARLEPGAKPTVALRITEALAAVRERRLIHQAISPHHVVVNPESLEVRLIDFGYARNPSEDRPNVAAANLVGGRVEYIAPEQTGRTNYNVSYPSDLYSLGVTLYQLFTGGLPYRASDPASWIHCHVAETPIHPQAYNPELPDGLCDIVLKLLEKNPADRYQSAETVRADLDGYHRTVETVSLYGELSASSEELERRVLELSKQLEVAQEELAERDHKAEMADIATGVLHNVGNLLNRVKTSSGLLRESLLSAGYRRLAKANATLEQHRDDLGDFFSTDPEGAELAEYYAGLRASMEDEQRNRLDLVERLDDSVASIQEVILAQQQHAKGRFLWETASLAELMDRAIALTSNSTGRHGVSFLREFAGDITVPLQRSKLTQILINLLQNAYEAIEGLDDSRGTITVTVGHDDDLAFIAVRDRGVGIRSEDRDRLFSHGFTTKHRGHGFGLHSCANYAAEMGGSISVHSDGPGRGTTFSVSLPIRNPKCESVA